MPKKPDPEKAAQARQSLLELIAASGKTQKECAALIEKVTLRPCPERTLRSWIADPGASSARPCPDWAVEALQKALKIKPAKVPK